MQKNFFRSLFLLVVLNLLVKPIWIFAIDRQVQVLTGYAAYGQYFALLNLSLVFSFLADLGITFYFNRSAAAESETANSLFVQSLILKLLLSVLYAAAVLLAAQISGVGDLLLLLLLVVLQILTSLLLLIRAWLTAQQHFHLDAIVSVVDKLVVIILAGVLIGFPGLSGGITIHSFVTAQLTGVAVAILLASLFVLKYFTGFGNIKLKAGLRQVLSASFPFALNVFFMTILMRADGFLLERLHTNGAHEAGIYAAAYRLMDAVNMTGFLFAAFLLPYLARHWPRNETLQESFLACRHIVCLAYILVSAICFAIPGSINKLLYHQEDPYSGSIIGITLLALPGLALVHIYGTLLTATGFIRRFLNITIVFTLFSMLLNLVLIRHWGALACSSIAVTMLVGYGITLMYAATQKTKLALHVNSLVSYAVIGILCWGFMKMALYFQWNEWIAVFILTIAILAYAMISGRYGFRELFRMITEK